MGIDRSELTTSALKLANDKVITVDCRPAIFVHDVVTKEKKSKASLVKVISELPKSPSFKPFYRHLMHFEP